MGQVRRRQAVQELLRSRKRWHRDWVSPGGLASCRSLDADPYTQSHEVPERIARPAILREAAHDLGRRASGRKRDGSGGCQDQETARRDIDR